MWIILKYKKKNLGILVNELKRRFDNNLEIYNGFDYAVEEKFHHYEYENTCLDWEFIEIENGFHLNCYPGATLHKNLEILLKIKEL